MHRSVRLLAIFACATVSACSKEAPKADSTPAAQAGGPAAAGGSYDPATHVATVIAKDFAFLAPDSIPAGWTTLRMLNEGPNLHHMSLVRLDSGKTIADLGAALKNPGPPPAWMVSVGGPNAVDPKLESNATMNLPAGNYAMLCFIDMPDHTPHMAKGMIRPLTVTASSTPAPAPTAHFSVVLADYSFTLEGATTLAAGKHTIKVVNKGPQDHEIEVIRLAPGKTIKDFGAWIQNPSGPPPASGLGGISGMAKGTDGYFDVELTPGKYALLCFIPGPDGKAHLEHGMAKEFEVK